MVKVAIAGGSSPTLGAAIVNALLATNGKHVPVILSRGGQTKPRTSPDDVETRYVDYADHTSLVSALQDIHTIISVLLIPGPGWVTTQVRLLDAAVEAGVQRFAPSEWALAAAAHPKVDIDAAKMAVWERVQDAMRGKHGLQATRFTCGMWMNYLGIGCPEAKRAVALAGFAEGPYIFRIAEARAEIPIMADASFPRLTITELGDVGRFVAASLDLDSWPDELGMEGETLRFDEVVRLAEMATGRRFEVQTVDKTELLHRLAQTTTAHVIERMECQLSLVYCDGKEGECTIPPVLNRLCPQVQPTTVGEYLNRFWS